MITVANVANASRGELLCITYELLLNEIEGAMEADNSEIRKPYINKALDIIRRLVDDLNFEYEIAHQLFRIYVYVQGLLLTGKNEDTFRRAYHLIHKIYTGYQEIAKQEPKKETVMTNTESIYAGLTYGKDKLDEVTIDQHNRGYQA